MNRNLFHTNIQGAFLEEAESLLHDWTVRPHDHISADDRALGIAALRAHNKYNHEWFHAIGELVSAIDDHGIGHIADRSKAHNIVTALKFTIQKNGDQVPHTCVAAGDQLLWHIIDMLQTS